MKTSKLTGAALNWAVAKCENEVPKDAFAIYSTWWPSRYSTDWARGGPISERERIATIPFVSRSEWQATMSGAACTGPTPLTAAMRCYVASKLGEEVEIPKRLLQ